MTLTSISPIKKFSRWLEDAKLGSKNDPTAVVLSTAHSGISDSRVVLMKSFDEKGFVFYTNYESQKGQDLKVNKNCSLLFYWPECGRQVRIIGRAEKTSREESQAYFNTRPLLSRYASIISNQSKELSFGMDLWFQVMKMCGSPVCPGHWGGYRVAPSRIEFWEDGQWRLHHRVLFYLEKGQWHKKLLYP